jgi:hypothetical protein
MSDVYLTNWDAWVLVAFTVIMGGVFLWGLVKMTRRDTHSAIGEHLRDFFYAPPIRTVSLGGLEAHGFTCPNPGACPTLSPDSAAFDHQHGFPLVDPGSIPSLRSEPPRVVCEYCRTPLPSGAIRCGSCGAPAPLEAGT